MIIIFRRLRAASIAIVDSNPGESWRDSHVTHAPHALALSDVIRDRIEAATGMSLFDHADGRRCVCYEFFHFDHITEFLTILITIF